jgi:hypothetical protein
VQPLWAVHRQQLPHQPPAQPGPFCGIGHVERHVHLPLAHPAGHAQLRDQVEARRKHQSAQLRGARGVGVQPVLAGARPRCGRPVIPAAAAARQRSDGLQHRHQPPGEPGLERVRAVRRGLQQRGRRLGLKLGRGPRGRAPERQPLVLLVRPEPEQLVVQVRRVRAAGRLAGPEQRELVRGGGALVAVDRLGPRRGAVGLRGLAVHLDRVGGRGGRRRGVPHAEREVPPPVELQPVAHLVDLHRALIWGGGRKRADFKGMQDTQQGEGQAAGAGPRFTILPPRSFLHSPQQ